MMQLTLYVSNKYHIIQQACGWLCVKTRLHRNMSVIFFSQRGLQLICLDTGDICNKMVTFFLLTSMRGAREKEERFHAINRFFSNRPLYKITKLSSSGAYWIIHLLLCLFLPFVQTFLQLFEWEWIDPYFPFFAALLSRICFCTSDSSL